MVLADRGIMCLYRDGTRTPPDPEIRAVVVYPAMPKSSGNETYPRRETTLEMRALFVSQCMRCLSMPETVHETRASHARAAN